MNNDLNFVLLQHGLIKLGAQNSMVKNAIYGALLRTLPGLVRAGARYLPARGIQKVQGAGRGIARWFSNLGKAQPPIPQGQLALPGGPPVISLPSGGIGGIGKAKDFLKARQAFQSATADTANAWNALNPWARRAIKYPAQIAAGYGLGLPFGVPGWLAFGVGNEKDKLNAGQEGAARALEGVQQQLAEARSAYDQSGILGRLAGGFTAAFNPDKIFSPIDNQLTTHIEALRGIKPKKTATPAVQQPGAN